MSYCKINLGGKERGLKFNNLAIHIITEISEKLKLSKENTGSLSIAGTYAVVFAGLTGNCFVKNEQPDFTFEEVCDWCDNISEEDALKVNEAITSSEAYKKTMAFAEAIEQSKKKDKPNKRQRNTGMSA